MDIIQTVVNWLVELGIGIRILVVYLSINKLWSRKHYAPVVQSISLMAYSCNIFVITAFACHFLLQQNWLNVANNLLLLVNALCFFLVGTGLWLKDPNHQTLWQKVRTHFRQETDQLSAMLPTFTASRGQQHLFNILYRLAWLDGKLDEREVIYITTFTKTWQINSQAIITCQPPETGVKLFESLCQEVKQYLALAPSIKQVEWLEDLVKILISIDQEILPAEEIIVAEIIAMTEQYLKRRKEKTFYGVVVHPTQAQEMEVAQTFPEAIAEYVLGDKALLVGAFYTERYANMISRFYLEHKWFATVHQYPLLASQILFDVSKT